MIYILQGGRWEPCNLPRRARVLWLDEVGSLGQRWSGGWPHCSPQSRPPDSTRDNLYGQMLSVAVVPKTHKVVALGQYYVGTQFPLGFSGPFEDIWAQEKPPDFRSLVSLGGNSLASKKWCSKGRKVTWAWRFGWGTCGSTLK